MRKKNDVLLDGLENSINQLKVQYDIFFNGGSEQPPQKAHDALALEIDRAMNLKLDYAQRFRLTSLASRLHAYGELWRRNVRMVEQGIKPAYGIRKATFEKK